MVAPAPEMVWLLVVKLKAPAPVWLKIPVASIPPLNSIGAVLLTENVPAAMVTNPSNRFNPPATAVMVKLPERLDVPVLVNVPVLLQVVVPALMVRFGMRMFPDPLIV